MKTDSPLKDKVIFIKGAGEKASAVAHRLYRFGFNKIIMSEKSEPTAERRGVSFCEALIDLEKEVCSVVARRSDLSVDAVYNIWSEKKIAVVADPEIKISRLITPDILVDAVLAKKNTGTAIHSAQFVIALGPGFIAGKDAHLVIETNPNSSSLGSLITNGEAEKDTGIPASVLNLTKERIIRAPCNGILRSCIKIGDKVKKNEVIAHVNDHPLRANISGVIWGLVRDGLKVKAGQKIGDIDPKGKKKSCFEISPHASAIADGVLEGIVRYYQQP